MELVELKHLVKTLVCMSKIIINYEIRRMEEQSNDHFSKRKTFVFRCAIMTEIYRNILLRIHDYQLP